MSKLTKDEILKQGIELIKALLDKNGYDGDHYAIKVIMADLKNKKIKSGMIGDKYQRDFNSLMEKITPEDRRLCQDIAEALRDTGLSQQIIYRFWAVDEEYVSLLLTIYKGKNAAPIDMIEIGQKQGER
jgi:hypothetical protein